jgi:hypothetical protein
VSIFNQDRGTSDARVLQSKHKDRNNCQKQEFSGHRRPSHSLGEDAAVPVNSLKMREFSPAFGIMRRRTNAQRVIRVTGEKRRLTEGPFIRTDDGRQCM